MTSEEEISYLIMFVTTVRSGIFFGLHHPIEWWINYRNGLIKMSDLIPPTEEAMEKLRNSEIDFFKNSKRFFNEMFEDCNCEEATKEKVEAWLCSYYSEKHLFKKDFESSMLEAYNYE